MNFFFEIKQVKCTSVRLPVFNFVVVTFILLFFFPLNSTAAVKKIVDDLAGYRTQVVELSARLTTLEKEINSKKNLYHSGLEQINKFDSQIKQYHEELKRKQAEVQLVQEQNKQIIQSYILESGTDATHLWHNKVHLELLTKANKKLKIRQNELEVLKTKVSEFDQRLSSLKKSEQELSAVISELEGRKNTISELYQSKLDTKKKLEAKFQSSVVKDRLKNFQDQFLPAKIVNTKPDRLFNIPIENYATFSPSEKGVTFQFNKLQAVRAAGSGRVVFAGDLASYGQVVLIDHGDELRTVLLGRMNIRVKKDDQVNAGEILAYTLNHLKETQTLYFEVRKKNSAQNTILWLDQKGVSKI